MMRKYMMTALMGLAVLAGPIACSGGGGSESGNDLVPPPPPPPPPPIGDVTITGAVTFDRVPFNSVTSGLDYSAIRRDPARSLVVEARNSAGNVLTSAITDDQGRYSLDVGPNTDFQIAVKAQLLGTTGALYDISVRDNTSNNALYVLASSERNSGTADASVSLNAPSGWGDTSYTGTRAAGPLAILDSIYEAVIDIRGVDPDVIMPPLNVFWNPNNRPSGGDFSNGDIGTSFFSDSSSPFIAILGAENNDTDEYDTHVIVHEFGHYIEAVLSRSDSTGGSHNAVNRHDARLSMGEGFGNAFSGMILSDPAYRDSFNAQQASGFVIDNERNTFSTSGWYNEGAVGGILYDVFDTASDGADEISAGFGPIYRALTAPDYRNQSTATTIFSAAEFLIKQPEIDAAAMTALLTQANINSARADAAGEINTGTVSTSLPYYKTLSIGGDTAILCSTNALGTGNFLGNYDLARFTVSGQTGVTVSLANESGNDAALRELTLYKAGETIDRETSRTGATFIVSDGEYLLQYSAEENTFGGAGTAVCDTVSLQ